MHHMNQQFENSPSLPPCNLHAEQSVLGALLQDNDAIDRIGDLQAAHFYRGDHRLMFDAILKLIRIGKPFDIITLSEALNAQQKVDSVGGLGYLNALVQNTPGSANIAHYAAIVRDKAIKRSMIKLGMQMQEQASRSPMEAYLLVDDASSKLDDLMQARMTQDAVRASDDLVRHIGVIEGRLEGGVRAIPTGFAELDARLSGGIRSGDLIVLAARPKMGKTAFALNVGLHVAQHHCVQMLSLEMPKSQLQDRHLANLGQIPLHHLLQPQKMTEQNWSGVTLAATKLSDLSLFLDDQGGLRLQDVRLKAKLQKRKHGLDLLIIDYLQLMEGEGDSRNAQIESITRGLKALAKELDCGILLLSQLNRELEKRPNKRPQPSDLRDSGAIEQDADAVIFLYRDEVYNPDSRDQGICEVDVALCRQGEPGRMYLRYVAAQTRFAAIGQDWTPCSNFSATPRTRRGIANEL
jgi:replicative DNA helicase